MNARRKDYRITLDHRQVRDVVSSVFHSLMVHRTVAKFNYRTENNYVLGSLGLTEIDCNCIDLSYVRLNSPGLTTRIEEEIEAFSKDLYDPYACSPRRTPVGSPLDSAEPFMTTSIGIEFYQKKRRWSLSVESSPWEQWYLILDIFKVTSEDDFQKMRESVARSVSEVILNVCSVINRTQYVPQMPSKSELNNVFETTFSDCQPYLFNVNRGSSLPGLPTKSSFSTVRRLLKDFAM
ncbi:unnamed protein product [Auanema sp. JU1783]|nr:unnamed protein product [Auanema sp. JU1783]